jgi:hypothetical protein
MKNAKCYSVNEIPEDLLYELKRLLKLMANIPLQDLKNSNPFLEILLSDYEMLEEGYNNLKTLFTSALIQQKKAEELVQTKSDSKQIDFFDRFTDGEIMSKKQAAKLCGKSETWIHKNKDKFVNSPHGVFVKDFLKWLKVYNLNYYKTFQENFNLV